MTLRTYHTALQNMTELQAVATAEGITMEQAVNLIQTIPTVELNGMRAWIRDPVNDGAAAANWKAAWSSLAPLANNRVQVIMRYVAELEPEPVAVDV